MITFITGLPGNGKTLYALWYIKMKAEKEQREVYYHNIKDLTLPWTVFDPQKWMMLPKGSIIVIDEAQEVFPKKPNGAALPDFYSELAKHRHHGFDIYLITQHPSLVDNFVRQLGGQHLHSVRKFGLDRSTIYEWSAVNPAPQNPSSQKSAITLKWAYPKEVYTYYKSAEVHTVKRSIPAKLILAVAFVLFVFGGGYWLLQSYQDRLKPKEVQSTGFVGQTNGAVAQGAAPVGQLARLDPIEDARRYVENATPRIAGLPHTAPKYDHLTEPDRVPVPAACIQKGSRRSVSEGASCKCFSQQGTAMDVEFNMCVSFANNGYFKDFDADAQRQQEQRAAVASEVMSSRPDSASSRSSVVAFSSIPEPRIPGTTMK